MDTNKKRILLSASIVTTVAALSLAYAWQGGAGDQATVSTDVIGRRYRPIDDTEKPRHVRPRGDREIDSTRGRREVQWHKPSKGRKPRIRKSEPKRIIKDHTVPAM